MKGYERLVSNDWEGIQLAGFPDESREGKKITSLMMDACTPGVYALLKETSTSVTSCA